MSGVKVRVSTRVNPWLLSFAMVMVLALLSRLYQLGTFPYFPTQFPWLGAGPPHQGLYGDESYRVIEALQFPASFSVHEASLFGTLATVASKDLLGSMNWAYRLPEALASALTAGVIFMAAKELYRRWEVALAAGLYFVVMIPALVFGRMVFYENLVGLFFAATIYFMARFENDGRRRWLYLGALSAALAPFGKVDGLFVPLFFTLWAVTTGGRRKKIVPAVLSWLPFAAEGVALLALVGNLQDVLQQWEIGLVGRELSIQYLLVQSMPSGHIVGIDLGYIRPDFWYLFGFLALGLLVLKGSSASKILVEALFAFVIADFVSFGIGAYYLVMLFPFFALAAGGGMAYFSRIGSVGALAFYTIFYAPLVATIIGSITLPFVGTNYGLSLLNDVLLVLPGAVWLALEGVSRFTIKRRFPMAVALLVCFFAVLLIATPEIYSYYFVGAAS